MCLMSQKSKTCGRRRWQVHSVIRMVANLTEVHCFLLVFYDKTHWILHVTTKGKALISLKYWVIQSHLFCVKVHIHSESVHLMLYKVSQWKIKHSIKGQNNGL